MDQAIEEKESCSYYVHAYYVYMYTVCTNCLALKYNIANSYDTLLNKISRTYMLYVICGILSSNNKIGWHYSQ